MNHFFTFFFLLSFIQLCRAQVNPTDGCPTTAVLPVNTNCVANNYTVAGGFTNGGLVNASCAAGQNRDDGWYSFVATSTTTVVDATGDRAYLISAWTACGAGTELACDAGNAVATSISFATTVGVTYFIQVHRRGGNNTATLTGTICVHEPISGGSNDDPCGATILAVGASCSFSTFTNATATASAGVPAPGCASYSGGDVWFSVIVPASGSVTVDMNTGVITDAGMAIYSGTCAALTLIECDDDDSPNGLMSMIALSGQTPGATLFIRVWEFGNDNNGTFDICAFEPIVIPPPPGPSIIPTACATQTFNITANSTFYDDGGPGGLPCADGDANNFCNCNCETTTTICAPVGFSIEVDFSTFAMFNTNSAFDWMKIYDAANTGGAIMFDNDVGGADNGPNGGTGSGYGDCGDDTPPSGFCSSGRCLTFEFHASGVINREGWQAAVSLRGPGCTVLLPITTTNFFAVNKDGKIELSWETSSEIDNDYFTIERSEDAINWETFKTVDGAGNSNMPLYYQEFDYNPFLGYTYYRLKQTDINNNSSYSQIRVVTIDSEPSENLIVYPNPSNREITIMGSPEEISSYTIFNTLGQNVSSSVHYVGKNANKLVLDISELASGLYTIRTKNAIRQIQKN